MQMLMLTKLWRPALFAVSLCLLGLIPGSDLSADVNAVFTQTDWTGGASSQTAAHPGNQTGWSRYSSRDDYIDTSEPGTVIQSARDFSFTETSDEDFAAGLLADVDIYGEDDAASLRLQSALEDPFVDDLGQWTGTGEMPVLTWWSAYVRAGGYIYALWTDSTFARFSMADETWEFLADMPRPFGNGAALAYAGSGDFIYATRGASTKDFYRYSISTNIWTRLKDVDVGVDYGASLASYENGAEHKVFCVIGGSSTQFYAYDIPSDTWTLRQPTLTSVSRGGALVYPGTGEYLYLTHNTGSTSFAWFHVPTNAWASLNSAPFSMGSLVYPGTGDHLYAWREDAGSVSTFARFSLVTRTWQDLSASASLPLYQYRGILYYPGSGTKLCWLTSGNCARAARFDTGTLRWDDLAADPVYSASSSADMLYDGTDYIYFIPGGNSSAMIRYSIANNQWTTRTSAPFGLYYGAQMARQGDYIYTLGGYNTKNFARYNISSNNWTRLADTPDNVYQGGALVAAGGYIYAFRAYGSAGFWRYDPAAGTWDDAAVADMPSTTHLGAAMIYPGSGDLIYVLRGNGTNTFWQYSISGNTWTALANAPAVSIWHGKLTYPGSGNYLYAFFGGGYKFARYDITTNTWAELSRAPFRNGYNYAVAAAGDKIYAQQEGDRYLYTYTISSNSWGPDLNLFQTPPVSSCSGSIVYTGADTVFFFYGRNTYHTQLFWTYSLSQKKWTGLRKAPFMMGFGTKAVYPGSGDRIYVLEGAGTRNLWAYDYANNTWEQKSAAPFDVLYGSSIAGGGDTLFAAQGVRMNVSGDTTGYGFARYNISTNAWTLSANLPYGAYRESNEYGNGLVYVASNNTVYWKPGNGSSAFYGYNPVTNTWTSRAAPLNGGGLNGRSLYYPGSGDLIYYATPQRFFRYSISGNAWTELKYCGRGLYYGGGDGSMFYPGQGDHLYFYDGYINSFTRYSLGSNDWDALSTLRHTYLQQNYSVLSRGVDVNTIFAGGYDVFYQYNITTREWTAKRAPYNDLNWRWDQWNADLTYPGTGDYLYTVRGNGTASFARYSVSQNQWVARRDLLNNLGTGGKIVGAGSKVYCVRGGGTRTFWAYNKSANVWDALADTSANVAFGSALVYPGTGDYIYLAPGNYTTAFYRYSIKDNVWSSRADVPVMLSGANLQPSLVYPGYGDYIYLIRGGNYDTDRSQMFYKYSISQNTWESDQLAPQGFSGVPLCAYPGAGDYLFCTRGRATGDYQFQKYLLFKRGQFTSAAFNAGASREYKTVSWHDSGAAGVRVKVRSSGDAGMSDATAWPSVPYRQNGEPLAMSYPDVENIDEYLQYQVDFITDAVANVPALQDITIAYDRYSHVQEIISSAYDSGEMNNRLMKLAWSQALSSGTDVRFLLRTAPDAGGAPGAWGPWLGPAGTQTFHDNYAGAADYVYPATVEIAEDNARLVRLMEDYAYTQRIILDNTASADAYTDQVIPLQIDSGNTHLWENVKPDGADIRFADGSGNTLAYNLGANGASFDYAGRSAKIFVQVPYIAAGEKTTLYLKYGKSDAVSASNPDLVNVPAWANLMAWYRFDEASGSSAADSSGHLNSGTLLNAPVRITGVKGNALYLNGTSQYVTVDDSETLSAMNALTLSAWRKPESNGSQILVSKTNLTDAGNTEFQFWGPSSDNRLRGRLYNDNDAASGSATLTDMSGGTWYHVVMTWDGFEVKYYINGVLDTATASVIRTAVDTGGPVRIGRRGDGNYLKGGVDEVMIYNRALSAGEVSQIYRGEDTSLVPYFFSAVETQGASPSLSGWLYRHVVEIDNRQGGALVDYQINVPLTSAHEGFWSRCRDDGADVRFVDTDNITVVPYYAASFDHAAESALFRVKVPVIAAGEVKRIYLYYGRSDASPVSSYTATMTENFSETAPVNLSGLSLDGVAAQAEAPSSASLSPAAAVTLEADIRYAMDYWPEGWAYRKVVSINNTAGMERANTVVSFEVPVAAGMRADYADLRFFTTDHSRKLRYNVRSYDASKALVQVEMPYLRAGASTDIFMYYANPAAAAEQDVSLDEIPTTGLLRFWEFEEGSGLVAGDSNGSGLGMTLANAPAWTTGRYNGGLEFTGSSQRGDAGSNLAPGRITLGGWLYRMSSNTSQGIMFKNSTYALVLNGDTIRVAPGNNFSLYNTGVTLPLNTWTHVIWTYDGNMMRLYVNGVQAWAANLAGSLPFNNNITYVGYSGYWADWWWNGRLDDMVIYDRALSATEVGYLYGRSFGPMAAVFSVAQAQGAVRGWLPGFAHRKRFTISHAASTTLFDQAVSMQVGFEAGKMKADYADVCFVNSAGQRLNARRSAYDGAGAVFLVKIPIWPAGQAQDIFMYYGNPDAVQEEDAGLAATRIFRYPDYTGWMDNSGSYRTWSNGMQLNMMGGRNNYGSGAYVQYVIPYLQAGTYTVAFDYFKVDSWDGEAGQLYVNNALVWSHVGGSAGLKLSEQTGEFIHTGGPVVIKFTSALDEAASNESFGVDNISIPALYTVAPVWGTEEAAPAVDQTVAVKSGSYGLKFTDDGLTAVLNGTTLSTTNYRAGELMHAAMTYDGSALRLYVDGAEKASMDLSGAIAAGAGPLTIGQGMNGVVDELRVWNMARMSGDINQNKRFRIDPATPGLACYLSFNENAGATAVDATIYGNNAALTGAAGWAASPSRYLNERPAAIYHMDEGSGATSADSSGNANPLALSATAWVTGDLNAATGGKALIFNGTSSYATAADSASLDITGKLSIELWVNPLDDMGDRILLVKGNPAASRWNYQLVQSDDRLEFSFFNGVVREHALVDSVLMVGVPAHVVVTFDENADTVQVYINSELRYTNSREGFGMVANSDPLYIGGQPSGANSFVGYLDEVRLYNKILTQEEIEVHYEQRRLAVVAPDISTESIPDTSEAGISAYAVNNPVVQPAYGVFYSDKKLAAFQELSNKPIGTDIRYQVSANGYTWNWWDGTAWSAITGGYSQTNTAAEINSRLAAFQDVFPSGDFTYRAYLHSDPGSFRTPSLDNVAVTAVTGETYYTDPAGAVDVNPLHSDADSDRWFQYKALLYSEGKSTPVLDDVAAEYIRSFVSVTAPNGGEVLAVGSSVPVSWTSQAIQSSGGSGTVRLLYSSDGGNIYHQIVAGQPASGTYAWTVPDAPSQHALLKVVSEDLPAVEDVSDADFRILSLELVSPNGGEVWEAGRPHNITWSSTGAIPNNVVKIEYSSNGGGAWTTIAASAPNSGSYAWTVPAVYADTLRVRVSSPANEAIIDESDADFSIVPTPSLTVLTPASGDQWSVGALYNVTWRANSLRFADQVVLEYSVDDFQSDTHTIDTVAVGTPVGAGNNDDILGSYTWTVPDNIAAAVKVRVREDGFPAGRDTQSPVAGVSAAFAIIAPQIAMTSPAPGAVWVVGDTEQVTWASTGAVSDDLSIEYSLDGEVFVGVASGETDDGAFGWLLPPESVGETVYLRVSDAQRPDVVAVSAPFRVLAHTTIEVLSPNGGETLTMGTNRQISWRSFGQKLRPGGADYNKISIYYSTDNGVQWTIVGFNLPNTGTHAWLVPDTATEEALVRVMDADDPLSVDASDAAFRIVDPVITVTTPDGGEAWYATGNYTVTWTSIGSVSDNIRIDYSVDSGVTWAQVASGRPNLGSYTWSVADVASDHMRVRITDGSRPAVADMSDGDFTVAPPTLALSVPDGGEEYAVGTVQGVSWSSAGGEFGAIRDNLTVQFSSNSGTSWSTVASGEVNDGTYSFLIPDSISAHCRVRIFDASRPATADVSAADFSIVLPKVTLMSPNGTEEWPAGSVQHVRWSSLGAVSDNLRLEYSKDNFATAVLIAEGEANDGDYTWTVPDDISSVVKLRITDLSRPAITDISDTVFSIVNPIIAITYPNGGELLSAGDTENIVWTNIGYVGNSIRIEYSKDNFVADLHLVAAAAPNTAAYAWTVPVDVSATVKLRLTDNTRPVVWDKSNGNFTILPAPVITITSPAGGEVWRTGTVQQVTWTDNGGRISNNLALEYSTDSGVSWKPVATGEANDGSYAWTVPSDVSETVKLKIVDLSHPTTVAVSPVFVIAAPRITVTSPNGAEVWAVADQAPVTWTTEGTVSDNLVLEYSPDAGTTWYAVRGGIANSGSFTWSVADNPTERALVRLKDGNNPAVLDVSDAVFVIIPLPTLTITTPNGGEEYVLGNTVNVAWSSRGLDIANITLDYSNDSFMTRRIIATNLANTGTYTWVIPQDALSGQTLQIRLTDGRRTQIMDRSDGFFRIRGGFNILSPNGSEKWVAKAPQTISWQTLGTVTTVRLEYTVDGINWAFIAAPQNTGTYTWTTPDIRSDKVRVKISDANDDTVKDESDADMELVYATVTFKVLDYDTYQHMQDLTVSEPASGWSDTGVNSPVTRTSLYPYGSYTTFFSKQEYIDNSVSWSPPKQGTDPYVVTAYLENSASAQVSWEAILTYSFSPATDSLMAVGSLQRKGKLVGTTELERADMGLATFKIYEPDGATVRNTLTAVTPATTGMYNFTLAETDFESGKVYPATLSIEYRGREYTSAANIDVGSEILQYQFFTETSKQLMDSVSNIQATVTSTATDIKENVKADIASVKTLVEADTARILATTQQDLPAQIQAVQDMAEKAMRSQILNTENSVKAGDTLTIRYRTFSGLKPVIDVYNEGNVQELTHAVMTEIGKTGVYEYPVLFYASWGRGDFTIVCSEPVNGTMDALTITVRQSNVDQIYSQVSSLLGTTAGITNINTMVTNLNAQFAVIEAVMTRAGRQLTEATRVDYQSAVAPLYGQLVSVAKQIRNMTGDQGINMDKIYNVVEERKDDMVYLRNKTQELKAAMQVNQKLIENMNNKPVTQVWYEYKE